MNEHKCILNIQQGDKNRARESLDTIADRRSLELHIDEEYSVTPSETMRSWLPSTIMTCMTAGRSEADVPAPVTCDVSSIRLDSSRKKWYERPDSL
jgi:hypothetical protein